MTLEAERRFVDTMNTLQGFIKQRHVRHFKIVWQICFINRKTVVLTGDHHHVTLQVFHRVVGTMVTKLHLDRFSTAGQSQ